MSEHDRQHVHDLVTNRRPPAPVVLQGGPADGTTVDFYGEPWSPIRWVDSNRAAGLDADPPEPVAYQGTGRFDGHGRAIYTLDGRA